MNLEFFKEYGIFAKKSLGQNFLIDDNVLNTIASSLNISGNNILEIGPGYGALTEKILLQHPKSLHLVELDKDMIEIINKRLEKGELKIDGIDFQIFNEDILKFKERFNNYLVIANIPYYITSPILYKFLYEIGNKPDNMLILMQKDVGDKILAGQSTALDKKNNKQKSSVLSLFISKKAFVKEIIRVPAKSFIPAPKVESSVLLFELHNNYRDINDDKFIEFIKIGFKEPRKKLVNNLVKGGYEKEKILKIFNELGFREDVRGEDLSIDNWIKLLLKVI
nr:16S rRNA (adenine(1518)-N(6)/adenine(1519)-N(6))-dimethyltransferase RsmA [Candidatus Gracilibacteria bacterium]